MAIKVSARIQRAIDEHFAEVYKLRDEEDKKPYSDAVYKYFKPESVSDFGVSRCVTIRVSKRSYKINYTQWFRGVPQFKHDPDHMDDDEWYYPKRNVTISQIKLVNHGMISDEDLSEAWAVRHIAVNKFLDLYQTRTN